MKKMLFLGLGLLLMVGCGPRKVDPAAIAVERAIQALYRNDMPALASGLTPESLSVLQSAAGGSGGVLDLTSQLGWEFERPVSQRAKVVAGNEGSGKRLVELEFGGQLMRFPVVKIGHTWKVALVEATHVKSLKEGQ